MVGVAGDITTLGNIPGARTVCLTEQGLLLLSTTESSSKTIQNKSSSKTIQSHSVTKAIQSQSSNSSMPNQSGKLLLLLPVPTLPRKNEFPLSDYCYALTVRRHTTGAALMCSYNDPTLLTLLRTRKQPLRSHTNVHAGSQSKNVFERLVLDTRRCKSQVSKPKRRKKAPSKGSSRRSSSVMGIHVRESKRSSSAAPRRSRAASRTSVK